MNHPDSMNHPLSVGTRISYADLSPRVNAIVVNNDNTSRSFQEAVAAFNRDMTSMEPIPPDLMDYIILVEGELQALPVQAGGVEEPIAEEEHWDALFGEPA